MTSPVNQAAIKLLDSKKVVLAAHVNPDGDTLGSIVALALALKMLGKDVTPLSAHGVPEIYTWMPGMDLVQTETKDTDFDLAVMCDAGALSRVGSNVLATLLTAPFLIHIDHHVTGEKIGNIRVLDQKSASTAELVWKVLVAMERISGRELLNKEIALNLMTGIITDTGSFRYLNVTPSTFTIAAKLQRLGAIPAPIGELVFENRSEGAVRLLGLALRKMEISENRLVAWSALTAEDFQEFDATDADTEGIVSHVRAVNGVQVGLLFREIAGKPVRVSLRAREGNDVNRIANVFGGGGHHLASGCTMDTDLPTAVELVVAETIRQVKPPG